jgi:hypothetical protein
LPLHHQRGHVEARSVQRINVASQLLYIHLEGLLHFSVEVGWGLGQFAWRGGLEGLEFCH